MADFVAMLASGAASVLPWVGAGVGAAVALYFAFLGIRAALTFFLDLAEVRRGNGEITIRSWESERSKQSKWDAMDDNGW